MSKPLQAYYAYIKGCGDGVVTEIYIIGDNPYHQIDFAHAVNEQYVNLKRDYHLKKYGVDRNNVTLHAIMVPPKEYDEKIKELSEKGE